MKKVICTVAVILIGIIAVSTFTNADIMKKDVAAPGYTSSPGNSLKN